MKTFFDNNSVDSVQQQLKTFVCEKKPEVQSWLEDLECQDIHRLDKKEDQGCGSWPNDDNDDDDDDDDNDVKQEKGIN